MEGFRRFSGERLDELRARYRGDDLFRVWTRTLCALENSYGELNAVEVWSEAEEIRLRLAEVSEYRENEVEFLFGQLRKRHRAWIDHDGKNVVTREADDAVRTAIVILTVLFTQFSDGAPDEEDDAFRRNPNRALCHVLARVLTNPDYDAFFSRLIGDFTRIKEDYDGRKIVLPVVDYMGKGNTMELMGDDAKREVESMVKEICELTRGIRIFLTIGWDEYCEVWRRICANAGIMHKLKRRQPNSNNNSWGKNLTLVANVIGMMRQVKREGRNVVEGAIKAISDAIGPNVRAYISNVADHETASSPLSKEQYEWVRKVISGV